MPVIGQIACFLQCVFVDRSSAADKNESREKIRQRIGEFEEKADSVLPIAIFPEGAVSNGRSLLSFKRGAFENLSPITVLCLRYECNSPLI
jgi:1-acyl-sn-glycerol-3-phosphate acyltransferase